MKRLIILRHGKSDWSAGAPSDHARPLNQRGTGAAMTMGRVLTRLGEGSRMVVTGDPTQVDLPRGTSSGLAEAVGLLSNIDAIDIIRFGAEDIVRHPLVTKIVNAYEAATAKRDPDV